MELENNRWKELRELVLGVERLRFAIEFGLGGDQGQLMRWSMELAEKAPHHPIARNLVAFRALPETALPAPPPHLTKVAEAFKRGELDDALAECQRLLSLGAGGRLFTVAGDVLAAMERYEEAGVLYKQALDQLGGLAPIHTRLVTVYLRTQRHDEALDHAVEALVENPIYGTARAVLHNCFQRSLLKPLPIPIPEQARLTHDGNFMVSSNLVGAPLAAWRSWCEALQAAGGESPPRRSAFVALLSTFQSEEAKEVQRYNDPSAAARSDLQRLLALRRENLLAPYLWVTGLTPRNANAFRHWREGERYSLERFWREAPFLAE